VGRLQVEFAGDQVRPPPQQIRGQARGEGRLGQCIQAIAGHRKAFGRMADEQRQCAARLDFLLLQLRNDQLGIGDRGALRGEFRRADAAGIVAGFREMQYALCGLEVQAGD